MQKLLNKINFVSLLNILVLFIIVFVLMHKFKYAVIINDDIPDYFINSFKFLHGRFIESVIQSIIIGIIPLKFNLNIQNFSAFTQSIIKSFLTAILAYTLILPFYKFNKRNIYMPIGIIFTFAVFLHYILKLQFTFGLEVSAFFFGYIMPIPFFALLWLNLYDIIIQNNISKKRLFYTAILALIAASGNEMYNFVLLVIIFSFILYSIKNKNIILLKQLLLLIILISIIGILVITNTGFTEIVNGYNLHLILDFSFSEILRFMYVYLIKLFKECFILWIPIMIFILANFPKIQNKNEDKKITLYIIISLAGFLLFFSALYFLGETFSYQNYEPYNIFPKYWILQPGILIMFYMFLLMIDVFIFGYTFNKLSYKINPFIKICICIIIVLFSTCSINSLNIAPRIIRETLYKLDKYSVFYFTQGKIAVLSDRNIEYILPTYTNDMPKDLEDKTGNAYRNKIYTNYPYLKYIKKLYKVDTSKGMTFKSEDEAKQEFINNGGAISDDELKRLDFSEIKKQIEIKK